MQERSNLFGWSPTPLLRLCFLGRKHAGETLGPRLVERILKREGLDIRGMRGRLYTRGSVMHFADSDAVIWGSGIDATVGSDRHRFAALDLRAVRGPLTAERLGAIQLSPPAVYGDPGLLTSIFWPGYSVTRTASVYIPSADEPVSSRVRRQFRVLPSRLSLGRLIDEVQSAARVVTTSLHGLVIAESYGVPVSLVCRRDEAARFEAEDYYRGTDRPRYTLYESADEALEDRSTPFDPFPVQQRLLESFPFDLWR